MPRSAANRGWLAYLYRFVANIGRDIHPTVSRNRNKDQAAQNTAEAQRLAAERSALNTTRKELAVEKAAVSAEKKSLAGRSAVLDRREEGVRRDAKTVRNVRIASGQGVSRSLNKIIDRGFESQDVR